MVLSDAMVDSAKNTRGIRDKNGKRYQKGVLLWMKTTESRNR